MIRQIEEAYSISFDSEDDNKMEVEQNGEYSFLLKISLNKLSRMI